MHSEPDPTDDGTQEVLTAPATELTDCPSEEGKPAGAALQETVANVTLAPEAEANVAAVIPLEASESAGGWDTGFTVADCDEAGVEDGRAEDTAGLNVTREPAEVKGRTTSVTGVGTVLTGVLTGTRTLAKASRLSSGALEIVAEAFVPVRRTLGPAQSGRDAAANDNATSLPRSPTGGRGGAGGSGKGAESGGRGGIHSDLRWVSCIKRGASGTLTSAPFRSEGVTEMGFCISSFAASL